MNNRIYMFRGKAATGKTSLAHYLGKKYQLLTLSKDDLFDVCFQHGFSIKECNSLAYDLLVKLIQQSIHQSLDLIVDVGLSDTQSLIQFLSRIEMNSSELVLFHCDCKDELVWKCRIQDRLRHPLPHQFFTSFEEAKNYYEKSNIEQLDNEIYVDSSRPFDENIQSIAHYFEK